MRCEKTIEVRRVDLQEVRRHVEQLIGQGLVTEAIEALFTLITTMQDEIGHLSLQVRSLLRQTYGRRSEKVDPNQLEMFLEAVFGPKRERLVAEGPRAPEPPREIEETLPAPRPKAGPHSRKALPAHLPREKEEVKPLEEERRCAECGHEKVEMGRERSELLDWVPGHPVVRVIERVKMACPKCREGVVVAPAADKVVERGRPGPGLMAHLLVSKYQDHLPLNRQVGIFRRQGLDLSTSTLSDWVGAGADALRPIHRELVRLAIEAPVLGTDDTGLRVLDRDHEHGVRRGYLWCYVGYESRVVVFDYTPDRKAEGPMTFLEKRMGYVQCDGYTGYRRVARENRNVVWVGCMAHVRRKFVEALDAKEIEAAVPLSLLQRLYRIEAESKEAGDTAGRLLERRQKEAAPVMDQLRAWLLEMQMRVPPKTPLGRAITYAVNQWPTLQVYLGDGRIPLDNSEVERQIRRVAVGRKNYLFAGSDAGAWRAAILYSIFGTCSLVGADPYAYVRDVLDRISRRWPASRIGEILPHAWVCEKATGSPPHDTGPPTILLDNP